MTGKHISQIPLPTMEWVTPTHICVDIIYSPKKTRFLEEAEKKGAYIMNGKAMLASQAVFAFNLFTGHNATFNTMFNAIPESQ